MKSVPRVDEKALKESTKAHKKDVLANDEPLVLESSEYDPALPAMQEFEVDADGPKGDSHKHPALVWIVVAIVAIVFLCFAFAAAGDWSTPSQAEQHAQTVENEQIVPEDMGEE